MTWSRPQRVFVTISGIVLGLAALLFGLIALAAGAQAERAGALAALAAFLVACFGLYLAAAGLWGGWSPGGVVRLRIRSARVALGWVVLGSLFLCLGLPLTTPGAMTRAEWVSFGVLASVLAIAIFGIVAVTRRPRVTILLLGIAAAYALVMLFNAVRALLAPAAPRLAGPGPALSFALAVSLSVAIIAAFLLAWPLRAGMDDRAI
jgi:hypothetical protein